MDEKLEKKRNKRLAERERNRQLQRDEFVKAALTTPEGREYFYWLLEITRAEGQPFSGNALGTSFNCGQLEVGRQIKYHLVTTNHEGYFNILREKQKETEEDDRAIANDSNGTDDAD
jgi:hypothetical protein